MSQNDDLISRQAAIEIARKCHVKEVTPAYMLIDKADIMTELMMLPSAQPEIIRCKDCKHHWTHKCMDSMPIERCDLEQTFYDSERDFCSFAERRTDE